MSTEINQSILNEQIKAQLQKERTDFTQYLPDMQTLPDSDIMKKTLNTVSTFDYNKYTAKDVIAALNAENCSVQDFAALLSPAAEDFIEQIAQKSMQETRTRFGNSVNLFTPLYISNYCDNFCIYCGFNSHNKILRAKLDMKQIEQEMQSIAKNGLEEVLILTGESRKMSDINYIGEACKMARKYFKTVGVEIYPVNSDEYKYLHECGVDYVTVFQETYNPEKYEKLHLAGRKRIFAYRFESQERAILGGMRGVAFAALLGLDDFRRDAFATGLHAYFLQKKYPHIEVSFSCPRLRPIVNNDKINPMDVHEKQLLQVIMAYRIFMPYAAITISTRERDVFRDNVLGLAATKVSASVSTGIGCHSDDKVTKGDNQFEIADSRSVDQVAAALKAKGLQPVMNDYVYV